jgi:hypothetical protein
LFCFSGYQVADFHQRLIPMMISLVQQGDAGMRGLELFAQCESPKARTLNLNVNWPFIFHLHEINHPLVLLGFCGRGAG